MMNNSNQKNLISARIIPRISGFLRIFEELLLQCHEIACSSPEALFVSPDNDEKDLDEKNTKNRGGKKEKTDEEDKFDDENIENNDENEKNKSSENSPTVPSTEIKTGGEGKENDPTRFSEKIMTLGPKGNLF